MVNWKKLRLMISHYFFLFFFWYKIDLEQWWKKPFWNSLIFLHGDHNQLYAGTIKLWCNNYYYLFQSGPLVRSTKIDGRGSVGEYTWRQSVWEYTVYIALQGYQLSQKDIHPLELAPRVTSKLMAFLENQLKTPSIPTEATFLIFLGTYKQPYLTVSKKILLETYFIMLSIVW